jgi:glycosyltransferase involved in cell wall biosynthesis
LVGKDLPTNPWKDFATLIAAMRQVAAGWTAAEPLMLVLVGAKDAPRIEGMEVRAVPFVNDEGTLATWFRAADAYVHSAKVETFGNVLLEARACGTAVVTTAVGGIPEHVEGLAWPGAPEATARHALDQATGVLARACDPQALAQAVSLLLHDGAVRERIAINGMRSVHARYGIEKQAAAYLRWYEEILADAGEPAP